VLYRFLSALQQNRAQSRLLYLFYNKESDNFPTPSAEFSNQTLFSKQVKVASAVYYSLIRHAKISQSQSLLEWFKQFDWLTKRQLSITNWTSAKLSVWNNFERLSREERCLQNSLIDCFHDPIMQHVLGGSLHKNNTSCLLLGLYHAWVN